MASPNLKKRILDLLRLGNATTGTPGLPELATDADLVASIFGEAGYSALELVELQAWFGAHPITAKGAHNRSVQELPCVVVQRLGDGEELPGNMGDHFGHDADADTSSEVVFVRGFHASERFRVGIYAHSSSDMRDALYLAVRELLLRGRAYLEDDEQGIEMVTMHAGQDDQETWPNQERPLIVYTAELFFHAETKTTWCETTQKAQGCKGTSHFNPWNDER
mgnify:CR=1 FL=1